MEPRTLMASLNPNYFLKVLPPEASMSDFGDQQHIKVWKTHSNYSTSLSVLQPNTWTSNRSTSLCIELFRKLFQLTNDSCLKWWLCECVCVCGVYVCVHVLRVYVHVFVYIWCLPLLLSTLFFFWDNVFQWPRSSSVYLGQLAHEPNWLSSPQHEGYRSYIPMPRCWGHWESELSFSF